jgi:IPT/TIG domain
MRTLLPGWPGEGTMKVTGCCAVLLSAILAATGCDNLSIGYVTPDAGPTAGGTVVTIFGDGLSANAAVLFGGSLAVGFPTLGKGGLVVTTPPHDAGAVDVTVTFAGGDNSADSSMLVNGFTYFEPGPAATAAQPSVRSE